ncbi:hypothetical protein CONLIGDRAFT_69459 [Coniochaeta ligniaria NRRL 30616]|uniref:Uncharacterized protein n=1 Tax=Coniochaeta ligniaria NRRL 30616 TaxID=1408157 RepID=A0A1J7J6N5_9PEZI|nr:hypothetical protein CONLIGDRAFT_69459 [Coniochaeta ligniaria NRRL 30616]
MALPECRGNDELPTMHAHLCGKSLEKLESSCTKLKSSSKQTRPEHVRIMIGESSLACQSRQQKFATPLVCCRPPAWDPHADSRQFLHETISSLISLAFPLSATDAGAMLGRSGEQVALAGLQGGTSRRPRRLFQAQVSLSAKDVISSKRQAPKSGSMPYQLGHRSGLEPQCRYQDRGWQATWQPRDRERLERQGRSATSQIVPNGRDR